MSSMRKNMQRLCRLSVHLRSNTLSKKDREELSDQLLAIYKGGGPE